MKRLIGFFVIFVYITCSAQQSDKPLVYVNGGISAGNLSGGQLGVSLMIQHKYSFQLEYQGIARFAKETPPDYSGGFISLLFINVNAPRDRIESFRFMAGLGNKLKMKQKVRFNFKAGISYITIDRPFNWAKDNLNGLILVPNYTWEHRRNHQFGLIIKPEFEFIFHNFVGGAIAPYGEIASDISSFGLTLNLLLGKVEQRTSLFSADKLRKTKAPDLFAVQ